MLLSVVLQCVTRRTCLVEYITVVHISQYAMCATAPQMVCIIFARLATESGLCLAVCAQVCDPSWYRQSWHGDCKRTAEADPELH